METRTENIKDFILKDIGKEIKEILYGYLKAESFTYSEGEKDAEAFFLEHFSRLPYFQEHPEYMGTGPIPGDPFGRAAAWAMVRGGGPDTLVFIHHNDVVTVEDFKLLKPLAFSPDRLEEALFRLRSTFSEEARADLDSGAYLYGRGVCDMKGGGAIQMALLSRYASLILKEGPQILPGNLIVLAVPDEENLSAGMREAVLLLARLQEKYGLEYRLMVNSEPHQRKDPRKGVFSTGSVGKLMPFVYVRGSLAHAGKVFEGFNPLNLMSEIVRRTELNMELSDTVGDEAAPPPTWLFFRDGKVKYDVSMPLSVSGCFSILTLNQTPGGILDKVRRICRDAFLHVVDEMNANYTQFLAATKQPCKRLPWEVKVVDFSQLCQEARRNHGQAFEKGYEEKLVSLKKKLNQEEMSLLDCNFALVDYVYNYVDDLSPQVVFGLLPPYYPNVSNLFLEGLPPQVKNIGQLLGDYTQEAFGQEYVTESFYTGISDLSYTSISRSQEILQALEASMPLFGTLYHIPASAIEKISMPCVNIGPWGKDFHKLTERVHKEDLYERTPRIIQYAITKVLADSRRPSR